MKAQQRTHKITLVSTEQERKQFLEFPYQHYAGDEHWIAPLKMEQKKLIDEEKNPFFENGEIALFLVECDDRIQGRIAAIRDHRYNEHHDNNTGFFGFFECVEDQAVANLLLKVASDWLRERGHTDVLGPSNPSMMDEVGILVDGFEYDPSILMPYHKPYYDRLIKNAGFEKAMDLYAFRVTQATVSLDRMYRAEEVVRRRLPMLKIREIDLKNIDEEVKTVRHIFNKAWSGNWGFIPISKKELEVLAKDLKMILDPKVAHIAEISGEPVAFSIALPDLNQALKHLDGTLFPTGIFKLLWHRRHINRIRTALMGVLPEYQGKGIDALLHKETIINGKREGYKSSELSWVLESNTGMIRVAEKIGATIEKTYRMYEKEL
ncbi:GNAT family N-acetyltransferase [Fodinibius sediminis]|uniref:Acetyltransferase (GNAT) family protein n=1 Tax=Fodinibius sediminis TaxID=1214077 RepID=A0A521C9V5_9BACT|nr:GNAT family N-acetyltransferase [Fodinibius sediminis]SMO55601.1 Acetyltransferase (GNAT) family protein [Fodinibius sediminis]